jgi:hypothetical protein
MLRDDFEMTDECPGRVQWGNGLLIMGQLRYRRKVGWATRQMPYPRTVLRMYRVLAGPKPDVSFRGLSVVTL